MKLRLTTGVERRRARHSATACVPFLVIGAVLALSGPAAAGTVTCGQVISASTTLTSDVGPCKGDGLTVKGKNPITLDLGGHKVYAATNSAAENYGIRLATTTRSTVKNGEVTGFDAGVDVLGGLGNTVTTINAHDNINDNISTNNAKQECVYGDGIITEDSSNNTISNNTVTHNGPYSGVTLVGNSDGNNVTTNAVADNNVPNEDAAPGFQGNGSCGSPFSRPIQDIGIRIEGPGATDNTVQKNDVSNSAIGGITIHGYVYNPPSGTPDQPNTGNLIYMNTVKDTGKDTYTVDPLADGIAVLRQGPASTVGVSQGNTIANNTVDRSYRNGIFLGNPTQSGSPAGNTVRDNTVTSSRANGIFTPLGSVNNTLTRNTATGNATFAGTPRTPAGTSTYPAYDGKDGNPDCDNNAWHANVFTTFSPACVTAP